MQKIHTILKTLIVNDVLSEEQLALSELNLTDKEVMPYISKRTAKIYLELV